MLSQDAKLGLAMRFSAVVDDVDLGSWSSCRGLAVSFNPVKVLEGGANDHEVVLAGSVKYDTVSLTRAMTASDSPRVMQWLASRVSDYQGGTAQITLNDAHGNAVSSWSLRNVFPSRWMGPRLDANGREVAIETLELVHEGFL